MMKLKTNKTSTKKRRTKPINQKIKDWSRNINNKGGQVVAFRGGERKEKKKSTSNKPDHHHWHTSSNQERTWWCFQQHDEKEFLDAEWHRLNYVGTFHACVPIFFMLLFSLYEKTQLP